jgi:hypothetical protein
MQAAAVVPFKEKESRAKIFIRHAGFTGLASGLTDPTHPDPACGGRRKG